MFQHNPRFQNGKKMLKALEFFLHLYGLSVEGAKAGRRKMLDHSSHFYNSTFFFPVFFVQIFPYGLAAKLFQGVTYYIPVFDGLVLWPPLTAIGFQWF